MGTLVDVKNKPRGISGARQKIAVSVWGFFFILSLLSFTLSLISFNLWDRTPAAGLPAYFANMTQEDIAAKAALQDETIQMGFSLNSFAYLFTTLRLVGAVPLFILSVLIIRRYSWHLIAVLFAILIAVMAAGGKWNNPLFGAASSLVPWMSVPAQILNILLWFGLILLYLFPDGRFTPRWTAALVILLVPIVVSWVFGLQIFLNPDTWLQPLPLLPNLVFIGLAFFSVLYRYTHTTNPQLKTALRNITIGVSLLMLEYFILFFLNDVYFGVTGRDFFQTNRSIILATLISETIWYPLMLVYAVLAYRSIFRDRLFEM